MPDKTPHQLMKQRFKKPDRELVAAHHGVDVDHPALDQLLIVAVTYDLDPLMGHLWLVDEDFDRAAPVENGAPVTRDVNLKVGITRDGLLVVARRDRAYMGMEFDAVREKDVFRTKRDGGDVSIFHEYPDLPVDGAGDADDYRGAIVGAYCKTFVEGHKPTYYFAWMNEHGVFETEDGVRIFSGSWRYQSTMIIKAAQSVTLRLAMGITGVLGIDEVKRGDPDAPAAAATASAPESPEAFLAGLEIDPEVKATLIEEVNAANEAEANSWSLAKLRMRLGVADPGVLEEAALKTLEEIDSFLEARRSRGADGDVPGSREGSPVSASVPA